MRAWGLIGVVGMMAVAGVSGALPAQAADQNVAIQGFAFSPNRVEVAVGDTVTWQNFDGVNHTATADDGTFDSGSLSPTDTFAHTFTAAGEFSYICEIHSSMQGVVVVTGGSDPPPTTETTAAPTTAPTTAPPPSEEPPPTTSPPPTAAPSAAESGSSSDEAAAATTTTAAPSTTSAPTTSAPTTSVPSPSTTELAAESAGAESSGAGGLIAVATGIVVLGAAAGGVGWWRLRRHAPGSD